MNNHLNLTQLLRALQDSQKSQSKQTADDIGTQIFEWISSQEYNQQKLESMSKNYSTKHKSELQLKKKE